MTENVKKFIFDFLGACNYTDNKIFNGEPITENQIKESFEVCFEQFCFTLYIYFPQDCAEWSHFLGGQGWSFKKSTGECKVTRDTDGAETDPDWISGKGRCYKGDNNNIYLKLII